MNKIKLFVVLVPVATIMSAFIISLCGVSMYAMEHTDKNCLQLLPSVIYQQGTCVGNNASTYIENTNCVLDGLNVTPGERVNCWYTNCSVVFDLPPDYEKYVNFENCYNDIIIGWNFAIQGDTFVLMFVSIVYSTGMLLVGGLMCVA